MNEGDHLRALEVFATELRNYQRRYSAVNRRIGALSECGPIPEPSAEAIEKAELYRYDLVRWCVELFPNSTGLKPLGQVQIDSLRNVQETIFHGGRILLIEPRGFGKTTRTINAILWALIYGHSRFVVVLTSSMTKSMDLIRAIIIELSQNPRLAELFPYLCVPITHATYRGSTSTRQTLNGAPTMLKILKDSIVFPAIAPHAWSGAAILARPLLNVRGIMHRTATGDVIRPDLVFLDDVQTDQIANSPASIRRCLNIIQRSVLRLGGHAKPISVICTGTVIAPDDLIERLAADNSWKVVRYQMLASRATHEDWWLNDYAKIRKDYDPSDPSSILSAQLRALEFYERHREYADHGAKATWEWAYYWAHSPRTESSAIQHAYNIIIDDGIDVFLSEYQNSPAKPQANLIKTVTEIARSQHYVGEFRVPLNATSISVGIDVQENSLWYVVMAGSQDGARYIIHYGIYPKQPIQQLDKLAITIQQRHKIASIPGAIAAALRTLVAGLSSYDWSREDGMILRPAIYMVDRSYETQVIDDFARTTTVARVVPAKGFGIRASDRPMEERARKPGEQRGIGWRIASGRGKVPTAEIDTNTQKTILHRGFALPHSTPGAVSLYKADAMHHMPYAEHLHAEYFTATEGRGRKLWEWRLRPGRDNHFLDASVLAMVGLSVLGLGHSATEARSKRKWTKERIAEKLQSL